MNFKFPIFFIIFNLLSMALLSSASCLRGTRHMWQLQPTTEMVGCNRPSTMRSEFDDNGAVAEAAAALDNALTLGNLVYQCAAINRKEDLKDQPNVAKAVEQQINYPHKMNNTEHIKRMSI
ncbi:uncharacterized protein LOC111066168 [Drosophila obscura]|uniref:uncharacterized protein LOC111066168 n=1 Tax=Drosophila obscura TaxID=7282 RepID=UPI001BB13699|nr:uncharacterized protein LOC111066168 [Drosophila obscura]